MSIGKKNVSIIRSSAAEYLTFLTATGQSDVNAIYADENVWLSQKMMGLLYDVEAHTITYHLQKVFKDGELDKSSVTRIFRVTASDGKTYDTKHFNLKAIIAVGNKVDSPRAVQFRKWAKRLDAFLKFNEMEILQNSGKVTAEISKTFAETEFEKYRVIQDKLFESDFDKFLKDDAEGTVHDRGEEHE